MSTKTVVWVSCIVALFALSLATHGDEPWKDKPLTQWTQEDFTKLLEKSPWVLKKAEYSPRETKLVKGDPVVTLGSCQNVRRRGKIVRVCEPTTMRPTQTRVLKPLNYKVVWLSAEIVQQSLRKQTEEGPALLSWWWGSRDELYFSEPTLGPAILVYGPFTNTITRRTSKHLKEKVYLMPSGSKARISAVGFKYFPGKKAALFFFTPLPNPVGNKVRFEAQLGDVNLDTDFSLSKMTINGSPNF